MAAKSEDAEMWKESISPEERCHHELLFFSQGPVDGHLSGDRARDLFLHSGLPLTVLSQIWNQADVTNDNVLSVEEFVLAMHLILGVKEGRSVPKRLPKHLVPIAVPAADLEEISDVEKDAYQNVFNRVTQGHLDAIKGRLLFLESKLSVEELSRIWNLSDIDRNGHLDKQEWNVACHLIRAAKQGVNLNKPVNVFQLVPEQYSPVCYQARKYRVDSYNRKKHKLMTAKEKRKIQIEAEKKRLQLLKKRLELHKELYEFSKSSDGGLSIPEEEFLLYQEKEQNNIEKVEAILYRLEKEHENIRQITVKAILGEQGSLHEDGRLLKLEQESVRQRLSTCHTKATKDPDPFHELYEQRRDQRKRSTLSEGEEPEVHYPFHPFQKETLHPRYSGDSIFVSPDPSVFNNNNSHKGVDIAQDLCEFGQGFIEKWTSGGETSDPDYDPVFMSVNVPMDTRSWSGLRWSDGGGGTGAQTLHQKLEELKAEMEKLNEGTGGQLLFRNPEDYLAKRKAQEEEDRLEKSKYSRRFSDRRGEGGEKKDVSKRRSYFGSHQDEEAQRVAREYRQKRRSLNLDKSSQRSDKHGSFQAPPRPCRPPATQNKTDSTKELTVSTSNTEAFVPESASSPRSTDTSSSPREEPAKPSSPRTTTSPSRPSTKRKAAPPPPCLPANKSASSSSSAPVSLDASQTPAPQVEKTVRENSAQIVEKPANEKSCKNVIKTQSEKTVQLVEKPLANEKSEPQVEKPKANLVDIPDGQVKSKTQVQSNIPKPNNTTAESQPSRPPRRKKSSKSGEKNSFVHASFEKEQNRTSKEIAVNVDIKDIHDKTGDNKKVTIDKKADVPQSNIDDIVFEDDSLKADKEDSLLDTIIKELPDLKKETSGKDVVEDIKSKPISNGEDVIVASNDKTVECEIKAAKVDRHRGKFIAPEKETNIELLDTKIDLKEVSYMDNDNDVDDIPVYMNTEVKRKASVEGPGITDDFIKPVISSKRSETVDQTFEKIILFPEQKDKSKDTISIASDISSTGSEAPPLPDSAPPPLPTMAAPIIEKVPSVSEVTEVMEVTQAPQEESSPVKLKMDSTAEEPTSPIADLKASLFSMRVRSPERSSGQEQNTNGTLSIDVGKRRGSNSDSDISDDEGNQSGVTGTFSPGDSLANDIPMTTHEDDGSIQLLSHNAKLHSPNSDQSGPDSAFEDMQSSMTSNDPLSNTLDEIIQEELVSEKSGKVESQPRGEVVTNNSRKFELALERSATSKNSDVRSPVGGKDFMAKAHQFAESVQKPPKMTVKLKREIASPEDLTDEGYLRLEAERRAVISSSTMKKRNIDLSSKIDDDDDDTQVEAPVQSDPDSNIQEWRSEVNKRSNIQWEEKPDKVNLYSENIIQETENTETVDRDSIANLSTTRKQWETKTKPKENNKGKPKQPGQVRHWEVKLPTQLKKVPANVVRCTKDDSDSDTEKMADTEYANESAIEREIRLATEREELLRKEQEERLKLQERQNASPNKVDMKDPFKDLEQNNNEKPTYHEMTEADRGSELQQREEMIQLEIQEQEAREAAIRGNNRYEDQSRSSCNEDENANESIIEREIRLQREREMELEQQKNQKLNQKPVEEEVEEETVTVEYSEVVRTSPQSTPISTPDVLSETEDQPMTRQDARSRISYEEAIASGAHDGESLIARELREAREREEELQRMRQSMNGSVSRAPVQPKVVTPKETVVVNKTADNVKPTYQKDVSPYKNNRRQSQDSLSSHSTEKSLNATPRAGKVTTFGDKVNQMAYRTPERKEKTNTKKVETPIEREIRLARERENEYRIAKGLAPLKDAVKVEEESEEKDKEELKFTKSSFFSHGPQTRDNSMQKLATSRLQKEINKQNQLEKKYREEGKIKSTSEDHVGVVKYTDLAPAESVAQPKRNFSIARKSTSSLKSEPETKQNGTPEVKSSPVVPEMRSSMKFGRSVSSGGVTFSYKESHHKAESKIEQELREMREREEELRSQRSSAGLVSESGPESPRGQDKSVVSKRSQFEQTA